MADVLQFRVNAGGSAVEAGQEIVPDSMGYDGDNDIPDWPADLEPFSLSSVLKDGIDFWALITWVAIAMTGVGFVAALGIGLIRWFVR